MFLLGLRILIRERTEWMSGVLHGQRGMHIMTDGSQLDGSTGAISKVRLSLSKSYLVPVFLYECEIFVFWNYAGLKKLYGATFINLLNTRVVLHLH